MRRPPVPSDPAARKAARARLRAAEKRRSSSARRASASTINAEIEVSRVAAKSFMRLNRSRGKLTVMLRLSFTRISVLPELVPAKRRHTQQSECTPKIARKCVPMPLSVSDVVEQIGRLLSCARELSDFAPVSRKLTLVSNNQSEFGRVASLRLEKWAR